MRLNSGRRFFVPRNVGDCPLCSAASSASGAGGGLRVWDGGLDRRGRTEKLRLTECEEERRNRVGALETLRRVDIAILAVFVSKVNGGE